MKILEQSCKPPRETKSQRIMILCDRDGFANMKEFLLTTLKDYTSYIDSITEKMEDFFVFTDIGDYFVSCEDYVFYNIVNIILCHQESSTPLTNIPSIFYDVLVNENYQNHAYQIKELCSINCDVSGWKLDNNSYEIIDDIDWYDVSETTLRQHCFVGAEVVTHLTISNQLMTMFKEPMFCYDCDVNDAYIKPEDLNEHTSEYKVWLQFIKSVSETKEKLNKTSPVYNVIKACTPGCAAKEVTILTTLDEWYTFFKRVDESRMITSSDERQLIRLMAVYFLDYAYIESFKTMLKELILSIDTQEELPF